MIPLVRAATRRAVSGGAFSPLSLSGLAAWYDASSVGLSGSNVVQWSDKSGLNNHGTGVGTLPVLSSASTPNNGNSVHFGGGGNFTFSSAFMSGAAEGEIWAVIRASASNSSPWAFSEMGTDTSSESHYPYSGVVYESFGGGALTRQSFTPSLAITSWRLYRVTSGGSRTCYLDNVSQSVRSSTPVGWGTVHLLGRGRGGSSLTDDMFFTGDMAEIFLRKKISTGPEISQITAYINNKHGMSVT